MATQAPPQPTPGDLDTFQQLLIELGQARARIEGYEQAERERLAKENDAAEEERRRNAAALAITCKLRFIMQPQGRILIGQRVYTGYGPKRDRATGRIIRPGKTFEAPVDDARVLHESGYAEIIEGYELVTNWTPPVVILEDAAPAPLPGDSDGWRAREVVG